MTPKRDTVLDITKTIGIIIMVMGHLHFSEDVFDKYIYAFHMPLFFIVSGILFNQDKTLKNTIISRAKALFVPYESALWFLPAMFITSVAYTELRKVMDTVLPHGVPYEAF